MSEPRSWNETANIVEKAKKEVGTSISTAKDEIISEVKKAAESGSSASGVQTFTSDGTFTVPAGVTKILVTAFGAGGGGYGSSGGQGGNMVIKKAYSVEPKTTIPITIGVGGKEGNDGGATVIGNLVTLAGGGKGGSQKTHNGARGGSSGEGGHDNLMSYGGICGRAHKTTGGTNYSGGGGGGAGYERGGDGGDGDWSRGSSGSKGGIGAGGGGGGSAPTTGYGGNGGNGIVIIEW